MRLGSLRKKTFKRDHHSKDRQTGDTIIQIHVHLALNLSLSLRLFLRFFSTFCKFCGKIQTRVLIIEINGKNTSHSVRESLIRN